MTSQLLLSELFRDFEHSVLDLVEKYRGKGIPIQPLCSWKDQEMALDLQLYLKARWRRTLEQQPGN